MTFKECRPLNPSQIYMEQGEGQGMPTNALQ